MGAEKGELRFVEAEPAFGSEPSSQLKLPVLLFLGGAFQVVLLYPLSLDHVRRQIKEEERGGEDPFLSYGQSQTETCEPPGKANNLVLFKVIFFQYWNITIGIGAVGEGAGGAGRPCDPKLSKSGPSGIPLLACPSQRQFSNPWLLIKHIPWGHLTPQGP